MVRKVHSIVKSATFKDSSILFVGSAIATVSGFFITLILTRSLDPASFGLFITAMAFSQLVSDIFDAGLSPALISHIPIASDLDRKKIIKASFILRISISLIVGLFVFLFSSQIGQIIFKSEVIDPLIKISAIGIIFTGLINWGQSVFQSHRKFLLSTTSSSLVNIVRLIAMLLFAAIGFKILSGLYFVFQFVLIIPLVFILYKINLNFLKEKFETSKVKEIVKFGLPVGIGFAVAAVYTKLDQIMVFNMLGEDQAGYYGLAIRMAASVLLVAYAFNSVIAPRFASINSEDFMTYFVKTILVSVGLSFATLVGILISPFLFPLLFGQDFSKSIQPFQILMIGAIFFTMSAPFYSAILYRFKKPHYSLITSIISLGAIFLLLNLLIPIMGSNVAAVSVTLVYLIQLVIASIYFIFLHKKSSIH